MIDSTTSLQAPERAEIRAERRRIVESIRAHRRLLTARRPFELADRRRLQREARERDRADARRGKALHRIHEKRTRRERSLTNKLNGLDGKRAGRERQALAVLRRESIERSLRGTRLTASQVNGIGSGLVRDLAAQGITTAADFRRVAWGKAPNGRGGDVLYIYRTQGRKVHINGIGEHRGRPLMEWRRAAVARAEARAPHELPADERHRIEEIIENERIRLQRELDELPGTADAARADVEEAHAEKRAELTAAEREKQEEADRRRAEFDTMGERLLALQAELAAHVDRYGDLGMRDRRARSRAMRAAPAVPPAPAAPAVVPAPRSEAPGSAASRSPESRESSEDSPGVPGVPGVPGGAGVPGGSGVLGEPGVRASVGWLLPVVLFALTAVLGAGETDATPLWFAVTARLISLAVVVDLLRLWIPRRKWRTAGPMPAGTGLVAWGAFLGLAGASMFADPSYASGGAPWALAIVSALLVLGGARRRASDGKPGAAPE
ncbi:DMT family transporter [Streptomyces zaomyceticus]|uniref:DMT family transporter n=1 Tax=Streptomyces zaomyceticus TaxID=68286 RepID=UPI0033A447E1